VTTKRRPGLTTPGPTPDAQTPTTKSDPIVQAVGDIPAQLRRRRTASLRLPPMSDGGRRDPLDLPTRYRCFECGRDLRLARFHRIDKTRIVCRRCYRDR
jgi:hypothetical protein